MKIRYYWALKSGLKVPRKAKKAILGKRMSKIKLNKLLNSVEVINNKYPEPATILPYTFCPRCGCDQTRTTGNMAEHPEVWVRSYCLRCGKLVGEADNSPFYHVLEYKVFDYELY